MEKLVINNRNDIIKHTKYIGSGVNGRCYLTKDYQVIKIFKDNYRTEELFIHKNDIKDHVEKLSELNNDSYLAPIIQIICDGELIGYITLYGCRTTLAHIDRKMPMTELIEYYKKLEEDTYKVSEKGFWNHDLHDKNILAFDQLYVIDLDHGEFYPYLDSDNLFKKNIKEVNYIIASSLCGCHDTYYKRVKACREYATLDNVLEEFVYGKMTFDEYINYINSTLKMENPSVGEFKHNIKKVLTYQSVDDYYRHY